MMRQNKGSGVRGLASGRQRPDASRLLPSTFRPGITLVEVMVVLGLIAVITTGLMSLFLGALGTYDKGSGKSLSDTVASLALQKAAREIADGKSASVSGGVLTVQMPLVNSQGSYERASNGDQVKLYLSSGTLYKQVNSSTATALIKDVASASFSVSNGTVTLTITGQGRTGKNVMQTQMTEVVALRNVESS
jgi:type II secretory pathway pseudopilin PulG